MMLIQIWCGTQLCKPTATTVGDLAQDLAKDYTWCSWELRGYLILNYSVVSLAVVGKSLVKNQRKHLRTVETAYKAVMKPVEAAPILTVARESAKHGVSGKLETSNDIIEVMGSFYVVLKKHQRKTPDLLPVLKEVGVVWSRSCIHLPRISINRKQFPNH